VYKNWIDTRYQEGLVSVIIPLYNRASYIIDTLNSVGNQTHRSIECLIVDDGSTDNSREIVQNYIDSYSGTVDFKLLMQSNSGAQKARNLATLHSKGEFIQYLDSDDLLEVEKLKVQTVFLNSNRQYDAVFSSWCVGQQMASSSNIQNDHSLSQIIDVESYYRLGPIVNFSPLMRRKALVKIGPWDEVLTVNEELDYHTRFFTLGLKWVYLQHNSGLWRSHDGPRLSVFNNYQNLYYFYNKQESLLKTKNIWCDSIAQSFGLRIFWKVLGSSFSNSIYRWRLIHMAIGFTDELPHYKSLKVKYLKKLLGKYIASYIWFYVFYPFIQRKAFSD